MADVQKALRQTLGGEASITSLLASSNAIYYDALDQGNDADILPAIVLKHVSGQRERTLNGKVSVESSRIQVDCYASGPVVSNALSKAVDDFIDDYDKGTIGTGGNQVTVHQIYSEPPTDGVDFASDGSRDLRSIRSRDLVIWHTAGG